MKSYRIGNLIDTIFNSTPFEFDNDYYSSLYTTFHVVWDGIKFTENTQFNDKLKSLKGCNWKKSKVIEGQNSWNCISYDEFDTDIGQINTETPNYYWERYLFGDLDTDENLSVHKEEFRMLTMFSLNLLDHHLNTLNDVYRKTYMDVHNVIPDKISNPKLDKLFYCEKTPHSDKNALLRISWISDAISESEMNEELEIFGNHNKSIKRFPRIATLANLGINEISIPKNRSSIFTAEDTVTWSDSTSVLAFDEAPELDESFQVDVHALDLNDGASKKPYRSKTEAVEWFLTDVTMTQNDIKWLWRKYQELLKHNGDTILTEFHRQYLEDYEKLTLEKFLAQEENSIEVIGTDDYHIIQNMLASQQRARYLKALKSEEYKELPHPSKLMQNSKVPILFEQYYEAEPLNLEEQKLIGDEDEIIEVPFTDASKGKFSFIKSALNCHLKDFYNSNEYNIEHQKQHIIFMMHGYNSDNEDMYAIYSAIKSRSPKARIHSLKSIENMNNKGLFELGKVIADEIRSHLSKYDAMGRLGKVSFIGFSLGGLVLKAAISHIKEYKNKFHSYISLASPHLGCSYSDNKLFSMGIWAMSKLTSSPIINELRMKDNTDIEKTVLYKLSEMSGMEFFKKVLLVGSYQDSYSPLESSIVQLSDRMQLDLQMSKFKKMCSNFNNKLKHVEVYKLTVNFELNDNSFDELIGRKAHMQYLENTELIKTLLFKYEYLFC